MPPVINNEYVHSISILVKHNTTTPGSAPNTTQSHPSFYPR